MSEQLKPCPFCRESTGINYVNDTGPAMRCHWCKAEGPVAKDEASARASWNRRAAPEIDVEAVARVVYDAEGWMPWRSEVRETAADGISRAVVAEVLRQIGGAK